MKTLHFISLNSCFVRKHVFVRFAHDYRDFVADNDYASFIQIPGYSSVNALTLHVLRTKLFTNNFKPTRKHLQLSTDNKKKYCFEALAFSDGTSFEVSKKPSY